MAPAGASTAALSAGARAVVCLAGNRAAARAGPTASAAFWNRRTADHEFLKWLDSRIEDLTGHDWKYFESEAVMDWHHQEGHRVKARAGSR